MYPVIQKKVGASTTVSQLTQGVLSTAMGLFLRGDGTSLPKADMSLNNFALNNIGSPTEASDATTRNM